MFVVVRSFHYDFVGADGSHLVVHAFGGTAWVALNAIQGIGMRQNAHLPGTFGGPGQNGRPFLDGSRIERARLRGIAGRFLLTYHYPALGNRIASNFHAESLVPTMWCTQHAWPRNGRQRPRPASR